MPLHPNVRRCTHTKLNGKQCGSPALTGAPYCHFHADVSQRRRTMKVPNLESTADVQQAIVETIRAIIEGRIDRMRGNSVLYGLHLAQRTFAFNKMVDLHREDVNPIDRSVVQKILDEVQHIQEFEQEQELEQEAEHAAQAAAQKESEEEAARIARESIVDENGRLRTYDERFPPKPQPKHWTDDIPRDENGYLKPTRKQEKEMDRMAIEGYSPKKSG
jgi:hypothetical protein